MRISEVKHIVKMAEIGAYTDRMAIEKLVKIIEQDELIKHERKVANKYGN